MMGGNDSMELRQDKIKSKTKIIVTLLCLCLVVGNGIHVKAETEKEWYEDAKKVEILDAQKWLGYNMLDIRGYINELKEYPDNAYAQLVIEKYNNIGIEDKTDFEQDFIIHYSKLMFNFLSVKIDSLQIKKAWSFGYDENGMVIPSGVGELEPRRNGRGIILQVSEDDKAGNHIEEGYYVLSSDRYGGDWWHTNEYYLDWYLHTEDFVTSLGVNPNSDKGKFEEPVYLFGMEFDEYDYVETDYLNKIIESNSDFFDLLLEYRNNCFDFEEFLIRAQKKEEEEKKEAEERRKENARKEKARKNRAPEIGMSKSDVLDGLWGKPDEKNISEYEFGTHEQWVYRGKGYVYFEDGVVTSIQYR